MPALETIQIPLGFNAPDFKLLDVVSNTELTLNQCKGEYGTVVMFICNHCPYVIHIRNEIVRVAKDYIPRGINFIAISSNDIEKYPQDSPQRMKELAEQLKFPFPYLFDETQEIAKAYQAACTPDFNIFDKNLKCIYRGQFDDARPKNQEHITGKDIRNALDSLLLNMPLSAIQTPSVGCSIKWKPNSII